MPATAPLAPTREEGSDSITSDLLSAANDEASAFPPPPPSIQLTPLLGHPPSSSSDSQDLPTFYNLLTSQLATVVWTSLEAESAGLGGGANRKPVVVGLALKLKKEGGSEEIDLPAQFKGIVGVVSRLLRNS